MKTSAKSLCVGCTAVFLTGGAAWAQEACKTYTVVAGDNLRFIARSAYGDSDMYRVIYGANVEAIGQKADLIEVGTTLNIPCDPRDEAAAVVAPAPSEPLQAGVIDPAAEPSLVVPELPVAPAEPAAAAAVADPTAAEPTVEPVIEPVSAAPVAAAPAAPVGLRMVTGNGYAPFADEMLPGGGMFTQLVEMAVFRADPAITYTLSFVSDWQAHIDALLPSGAYDISFPWIRPECEAPDSLSPSDLARCDAFEFSAPFYEIVDGFFVPSDSPLLSATSYSAFEGKRICRPESFTTGVLEAAGLTAANTQLSRPTAAIDCFEAMAAGTVDLVSIDAEVGDSVIAQLGMVGDFAQNPHLMALQSLHVIAHKSNPRGVEMIKLLDAGVIEMYESGEWYEIVSTALSRDMLQK